MADLVLDKDHPLDESEEGRLAELSTGSSARALVQRIKEAAASSNLPIFEDIVRIEPTGHADPKLGVRLSVRLPAFEVEGFLSERTLLRALDKPGLKCPEATQEIESLARSLAATLVREIGNVLARARQKGDVARRQIKMDGPSRTACLALAGVDDPVELRTVRHVKADGAETKPAA